VKRVELAPEALAEVDEAARWYDDHRPGLGRELLAELEAVLSRVGDTPTSFPRLRDIPDELEVRRCLLSRFPYGVVFTVLSKCVRVIAFAHLKRQPGYWLTRVR
jgi:plasmid stabilization system protein ParE